MSDFYELLKSVLLRDDRLLALDGTLLRNRAFELGAQMDVELIRLLLGNPQTRKHFFTQVDDVQVFDKREFCYVVNNRQFWPDSYTRFTNKIGLTDEGENFLAQTENVQLIWPYKECLLEGGQTKDEQNRNEIFWNQLLAPDECDRLLAPKVLTGARRYTPEGETQTDTFDAATDSLLIKGNNLLAISSLLPVYEGKVKLIYIDPPYNTGNDSFGYNDRFNHSAWLTFMKNRLEIARRLLRNDGVILIQCDDNEQAYLKVLCDEIFKRENFIDTFVWQNTDNAPTLSKKTRKMVEFIHCYEKNIDTATRYTGHRSDNDDAPLLNATNSLGTLIFPPGSIHFRIADGTYEKGEYESLSLLSDIHVQHGCNSNEVILSGRFKWGQDNLDKEIATGTFFIVKTDRMAIRYQKPDASVIAPNKFLDAKYLSKAIGVKTNEDSASELRSLGLDFFSYPKPESLIAFLVNAVTQPGDLVVDFFAGSGTTLAVAHKMGRRFIGVEQMDYVETITAERLKKVIGKRASDVSRGVSVGDNSTLGLTSKARRNSQKLSEEFAELEYDTGGISKAVNWTGGGSFVYCELAALNSRFIDRIEQADQPAELDLLWEEIKTSGYISYLVDTQKADEDFTGNTLTFAEKKRFLVDVLDKNLLYVNYCDMNDAEYPLTDSDKQFTRSFYGK